MGRGAGGRGGAGAAAGAGPSLVGYSGREQRMIRNQLAGIPPEHLADINSVSSAAPEGSRDAGEWYVEREGNIIRSFNGQFNHDTGEMVVHPSALKERRGLNGPRTLIHEVGHNVTSTYRLQLPNDTHRRAIELRIHNESKYGFSATGLRPQSFSNPSEFIADVYTVWARGTDRQWNNTNALLTEALGENPRLVFGPRRR